MAMKVFSKSLDFYELFVQASENVTRGASLLVDIMEHFVSLETWAKEMHELEEEGDLLTHDIIKKLNRSITTPIDREDIHRLAATLDDILDSIWGVAERLAIFKLKEPTEHGRLMSKDLLETVKLVEAALKELRRKGYVRMKEHCIQINNFENKIDRDFRDALGDLYRNVQDPFLVIKWKDIYENLEEASDRCEDVADILDSIAMKNA
jgi:uncharacterized protein